jgi:hypothetical protein
MGRDHAGLGAAQGRVRRGDAVVEIDRIHLAEQLAGLDPITHLHLDPPHPTGKGRADAVGVAGLHGPDPEQGRGEGRSSTVTGSRAPGPADRGQRQPEEGAEYA